MALVEALKESEPAVPTLGDLAKMLARDTAAIARLAKRLESAKEIVFLNNRRIIQREKLDHCMKLATSLDTPNGFTVREFRDACGFGRNASIDLLAYLDRTGVTRRIGDRRHVVSADGRVERDEPVG